MMRRAACKAANPLKIRASLGPHLSHRGSRLPLSQSLKDQGKSRTEMGMNNVSNFLSRNPLKIRASLGRQDEDCPRPLYAVAIP